MKLAPNLSIREDMDTVGNRIKRVRLSVPGRTQEEFAKAIGVSRGAVANWELDKGIKNDNLLLIAQKCDVSMDWLSTGRGPTNVELGVYPVPLPKEEDPFDMIKVAFRAVLEQASLSPEESSELVEELVRLARRPPDQNVSAPPRDQTRLRAAALAHLFLKK